MKFDVSNLNPGIWFLFDEDRGEEGGAVCLRVCAGDDSKAIAKKTTKKKFIFKDGRRIEYEETDEDLRSDLIWDFCVVDWKHIYDSNDEPIPCTKDNKLLLMGKSVKFASFVTSKLGDLDVLTEAREEELAKN